MKCRWPGVIRLPAEEVTWGWSPHGTEWLADRLRLCNPGRFAVLNWPFNPPVDRLAARA
jgi:hypothetical protein